MTQTDYIEFENEVEVTIASFSVYRSFIDVRNFVLNDLIKKTFKQELFHKMINFDWQYYETHNQTLVFKISFKAKPKTEDELYCDCLDYFISTLK